MTSRKTRRFISLMLVIGALLISVRLVAQNSEATNGATTTVLLYPDSMQFVCENPVFPRSCAPTTRTATLANAGSNNVVISHMVMLGKGSLLSFFYTSHCPSILNPGKSCTITVNYLLRPGTGRLYVYDNASGSPQTISLSGVSGVY